jgi:hypothetical protein
MMGNRFVSQNDPGRGQSTTKPFGENGCPLLIRIRQENSDPTILTPTYHVREPHTVKKRPDESVGPAIAVSTSFVVEQDDGEYAPVSLTSALFPSDGAFESADGEQLPKDSALTKATEGDQQSIDPLKKTPQREPVSRAHEECCSGIDAKMGTPK